jgi:hypothetical protein
MKNIISFTAQSTYSISINDYNSMSEGDLRWVGGSKDG